MCREIQAARDVERDTLCVNGVLVVGSEGYSAVVGRVKRELGRVADPVAGPDGAPSLIQGGGAGGGGGVVEEALVVLAEGEGVVVMVRHGSRRRRRRRRRRCRCV